MFALAVRAREALILCGPLIFQHGRALDIGHYTAGMTALSELVGSFQARSGSMFVLYHGDDDDGDDDDDDDQNIIGE